MSFKVDKEEYKRRLEICKGNECGASKITYGVGMTCGDFLKPKKGFSCGCKLTWKASLSSQSCPQDKW